MTAIIEKNIPTLYAPVAQLAEARNLKFLKVKVRIFPGALFDRATQIYTKSKRDI